VEAHDLADNVTASMAYGVALLPTAVNGAPVANAAGPYQVAEGETVVLSAALSSDPNEATSALTYTWDLAFDGANFTADATGMTTTFTAVDGPLVQPIALRVTDSGGLIATTTSTVTVVNVSPHINVVDSAPQVVIGAALPITVTFSDSGVADSFAAIFAWGDTVTTSVNLPAGSTMVTTTHLYTADGAYEFTVTVRDNDGGSASTTKAVTVLPLPTPTPTATPTPIATETATPTPTETLTATPTETMTPINTPTETATPIATPTATLPSNGDSDGDTITDLLECDGNGATCADADGDGKPNQRDIDSDGDGIPDLIEAGIVFRSLDNAPLLDTDNDGVPDTLDTDADNDTVPDRIEGHDSNGDGFADRGPAGGDSDNDGLDDAYDTDASGYGSANAGASNAALGNTDSDTLDNWRDGDDDGDGLFTKDEVGPDAENPLDDDNNGVADYLQNTSILIKQLYLPMILK
jgi:PKD repeat protein